MKMENTNNKIITLSLMGLGILVWLVTKILMQTAAGMVGGPVGRALNTDFAMHVVPVLLGLLTFGLLQFNAKVMVWAEEVVAEIKKIVWPSQKDTVQMTIVVCIMLVIVGIIIGGFDILSSYAIDGLLNLNL